MAPKSLIPLVFYTLKEMRTYFIYYKGVHIPIQQKSSYNSLQP